MVVSVMRFWDALPSPTLLILSPTGGKSFVPIARSNLGPIAVNYFWFMGAILQLNIFLYAKDIMDVSDKTASLLVMAVAIGVGVGSYACAKLSRGKIELGLVSLGALWE